MLKRPIKKFETFNLLKEKAIFNQRNKACFPLFWVWFYVIKEMVHDLKCSIELWILLRSWEGTQISRATLILFSFFPNLLLASMAQWVRLIVNYFFIKKVNIFQVPHSLHLTIFIIIVLYQYVIQVQSQIYSLHWRKYIIQQSHLVVEM